MHLVILAVGALATIYVWVVRARGAARVTSDLIDAATDVRLGARRFRFQRRANTHPADSIDDARVAVAGIAAAFFELDGAPALEVRTRLTEALQREFRATAPEATELAALGRWLVGTCGTPHAALARLSKKLYRLAGAEAVVPLMSVVKQTLAATGAELSQRQREALHDLRHALHVR